MAGSVAVSLQAAGGVSCIAGHSGARGALGQHLLRSSLENVVRGTFVLFSRTKQGDVEPDGAIQEFSVAYLSTVHIRAVATCDVAAQTSNRTEASLHLARVSLVP